MLDLVGGVSDTVLGQGVAAVEFAGLWARHVFVILHQWVDSIWCELESIDCRLGHLFVYVTTGRQFVQRSTSIYYDEWYNTAISLGVARARWWRLMACRPLDLLHDHLGRSFLLGRAEHILEVMATVLLLLCSSCRNFRIGLTEVDIICIPIWRIAVSLTNLTRSRVIAPLGL